MHSMCHADNRRPKFYRLLDKNADGSYSLKADGSTDGYWKLLIDFKMYNNDGVGVPQRAVRPDFNMTEAQRMLNEYEGGHQQYPVAQGIVDEFVADYKAKHGEDIEQSNVQTADNTLRGSSRQYRFVEQIDNRASMNPNETFVVGATPDIWQRIGLANLPVVIDQNHIEAAIDGTRDIDHHLGLDMVKQLPQAIKKPIAIIRSDTRPGDSVVVILKLEHTLPSGERKQVITPVNVNGIGESYGIKFDSNTISSFFGKGNILQKLSNAISDELAGNPSVYWINKKEAYYAMRMAGVQFPSRSLRTGFIHSIQETSTSVNQNLSSVLESRQFKRWFGKSKIVDNAGKPLVVYHGSENKEIRTFITNNSMGTGGLYLTTDQSVAESFAKDGKVYPAYARVERPLIIDADYRMYDSIPAESVPKGLRKKFPSWSTFDTNAIVAWARENGNYDGVWIQNVRENGLSAYADDIVVFDENQVKSVYNVGTYNDDGNIYYSYQREIPLSNRDILEMAAGQIQVDGLTDQQKQALQNFKDRLEKLRQLQEQISQLKQIREMKKTNGKDVKKTTGRIAELNRRARTLENEIATAEDSELYKNILKKARKTVEAIERERFHKRLEKYKLGVKNNQARNKYLPRVMEQVTGLMDILTKPDTKDIRKRIPVELQQPILDFLKHIDFSSKRLLAGGEETRRDAQLQQKLINAVKAVKDITDVVSKSGYKDKKGCERNADRNLCAVCSMDRTCNMLWVYVLFSLQGGR